MGRPRKEATARRSTPILVKLTPAEHERLSAEVVQLHAPSLAGLVRERALTGTVTMRAVDAALPAIDRVALNRVGVNLNQIARALNEQGLPALAELEGELRATLARINGLLMQGAGDGPEPL